MNYRSVIAALTAGMLSGCSTPWNESGAGMSSRAELPAAVTKQGLTLIRSAPIKAQLAVTFEDHNQVNSILVYAMGNRKNRSPFCTLTPSYPVTGFPAADSNGNLWLPEVTLSTDYDQSVVVKYEPNCGLPSLTLQDPYATPSGVAVASDGTVYVANISTSTNRPGNVEVYPKGQTTPARTLGGSNGVIYNGVTVDSNKDVFATYYDCGSCIGAGLLMFKNGEDPGISLRAKSLQAPGAPTIDKDGNVLVPNRSKLHVFAPPYTALGKTRQLKGDSAQCALNESQTNIACADYQNNTVDVYAYPGIHYLYSFSKNFEGSVRGLAQAPG